MHKTGKRTGTASTDISAVAPAVMLLEQYKPFILLTTLAGEVFKTHKRNESKFEKRSQLYETLYAYEEGTTELFHDELIVDTLFETVQANLDKEMLREALLKLTDTQRRRIKMMYLEGYSLRKIANLEGADFKSVHESIQAGLKKLRKILEEFS